MDTKPGNVRAYFSHKLPPLQGKTRQETGFLTKTNLNDQSYFVRFSGFTLRLSTKLCTTGLKVSILPEGEACFALMKQDS